jgi:hypothetical protein
MDWIHLAQDRAKLWAVLSLAVKLREFVQWRTNIDFSGLICMELHSSLIWCCGLTNLACFLWSNNFEHSSSNHASTL